MSATSLVRLARLARLATAMLTVSLGAHLLGHGALPSADGAATGLVVCAAAAYLLSASERSLRSYLLGLAGSQLLLHLVFMATSSMPARGGAAAMTLAHATAVLLTAIWLRRADAAASRALCALGARVWRRLAPSPVASLALPWRVLAARAVTPRLRPQLAQRATSRRGPPRLALDPAVIAA